MAAFNLPITIPDDDVPRLRAASKWNWGQVSDGAGGMRDMTNAEIQERWRTYTIDTMKRMVNRYERFVAHQAADSSIVDILPT